MGTKVKLNFKGTSKSNFSMAIVCYCLVVFVCCLMPANTFVRGEGLHYKDGDQLDIIANKAGPFSNPTETYRYYQLPYCQPDELVQKTHGLGEIISGDRKVVSAYKLNFKQDMPKKVLCDKPLTISEVALFQKAVDEEYYFELFLDKLPIWGYVGESPTAQEFLDKPESIEEVAEQKKYLYTHLHFTIKYNQDQIIEWNATALRNYRTDITELAPMTVSFTYSASWEKTELPYSKRLERYQHGNLLPAQFEIHWLSIINSFVLVVLLLVFLMIILMRVLKNDFIRYMELESGLNDDDDQEETGWKLIHGDVFRFPAHKILFSAVIGCGTQLFCMIVLLLVLVLFSVFTPTKRGSIATALIILYSLTAGIGGYVSASLYKQLGGEKWVWNVVICGFLFPGPMMLMFIILNSIAVYYESTAALPFGTIMLLFFLNVLVTFPLTIMGGIVGRKNAKPFEAPCRTMKIARQIPSMPWYRRWISQVFMAGFLPFSAIYIELHYIFASIWGHKIYTLFGILALAFVLLLFVTSFITIALVYFQLASEDHRWWWRSLFYGGSTGMFVYMYCFFYYFQRSEMSGTLQTAYFFGYMLIVSYAFFLLLGTVGFYSALIFVKHIYKAIKTD